MYWIPPEAEENLAREFETLHESSPLWATMSRVGRILSSTLEPDRVLELILEQAVKVLDAEGGSLLLVDQETKELVFEMVLGPTSAELVGTRLPWGVGLVGETAATAQPLLVNNTANDPRWFSGYDDTTNFTTQSILCAPMITRQQVIGVLEMVNKRDGSLFDKEEADLLLALASQAAVALRNAQLYTATRRQAEEVATLLETTKEITSNRDLDQRLSIISHSGKELIDADACIILLLDQERQVLNPISAVGYTDEDVMGITLQVGEGISGQVAASGVGRVVNQAHIDPDAYLIPDTSRDAECILSVPLRVKGSTIGVMTLSRLGEQGFSKHDLDLISSLGSQAAIAIENAILYAELQERAKTLQTAYNELAKIDQLKDELVQNISHELRTPLAFIKGYIDLLLEGELGKVTEQQQRSLEIVSNKTAQLTHLVNGILTLQTPTVDLMKAESISPTLLVSRAVAAAIPATQEAGIDLVSDFPPDIPDVEVDVAQITQVLDNLLNNAIKFSPNGGTIRVRLVEEETMVMVQVSDTGIGIPPEAIDRIFERFYQVDGSTTRRFGGAGLGLAICRQIINAHGGIIDVKSRFGEGSTFSFTIPKTQSK